jgi:hypothetical protein
MPNGEALTYGERAVGISFNPSGNDNVSDAKQWFADIIDMLNEQRKLAADEEHTRLFSIAITEAQTAQMWAVKALTWRA